MTMHEAEGWELGGIDVRLRSSAGPQSLEVAVRAIRQLWPSAVIEDGNTGQRYNDFSQIPFGEVEELFVYRDAESANVWDQRGAIPDVSNTMIHLLHDEGLITVVVDDRDCEMNDAIAAIQSALNDSIFSISALRRAA